MLLAKDPIMSGISIRSFRHLEHQNPSIISEDICQARIVQQFRSSRIREEESDQRRSWRSTVGLGDVILKY